MKLRLILIIPVLFLAVGSLNASRASADDGDFSKLVEIANPVDLGMNESFDSKSIDVSGFRYAHVLIEPSPTEKLSSDKQDSPSDDHKFKIDTLFYMDPTTPMLMGAGSRYPQVINPGFAVEGKVWGITDPAQKIIIGRRGIYIVKVVAPYMVVRIKNLSQATSSKVRLAVYLRK